MLKEKLKEKGHNTKCPITILTRDGKILVGCRHYRKDKVVWTIPGGRSDPTETIEETLRREVLEEVGIDDFEIIDFIAEAPGAKEGDIVPIFFSKTNQDAKLMEPEKFSEWCWVNTNDYIEGLHYNGFSPTVRGIIVNYLKKLSC